MERATPANAHCRVSVMGSNRLTQCLRSATGRSQTFFKPIQFHLQPPDLRVKTLRAGGRILGLGATLYFENTGSLRQQFSLPFANLMPSWLPPLVMRHLVTEPSLPTPTARTSVDMEMKCPVLPTPTDFHARCGTEQKLVNR